MKLYLSGPMSGHPDLNFPAFFREASCLEQCGYEVCNPATLNPYQGASPAECLRVDLAALLECDGVAVLPDWEASAGARLEVQVANSCGIPVATVQGWVARS